MAEFQGINLKLCFKNRTMCSSIVTAVLKEKRDPKQDQEMKHLIFLFVRFWLEKILLDFKKQNEVTKKAQEWMSLGSVAGVSSFLWEPSACIPSAITVVFKQGRNHWVSAGNMWYFQTRRKSLKLGNASMCHSKAHFILSRLHLVWLMLSGTACDTRSKEPEKLPIWKRNLGVPPQPV